MKKHIVIPALALSLLTCLLQSVILQSHASPVAKNTAPLKIAEKKDDEPDLNRFEGEVRGYELQDRKHSPAEGGTLFIGSSTFRMWSNLEEEFKQFHAVNRGFGGSTFPDINHYVDRIVTKYKPKKIVVYAGTNDIAELHHDGKAILADFEKFVFEVRKSLPDAEIYFISMSMAPSRVQWAHVYDEGNKLVQGYISKSKHMHYIDVLPVMHNAQGKLRTDLFGFDNLHMNKNGYALWTPVITKALQK